MNQFSRLSLPQVTVFAVTSINVAATLRALEVSLASIDFAACKLLTDADIRSADPRIEIVQIPRIGSSEQYSRFLLHSLADHFDTSHCLVMQWDGHVLDPQAWDAAFLGYDYIGASWPQFDDGFDVGNGGFSLRSRRLVELCRDPGFIAKHPEDTAIGRTNRAWLEEQGVRFAPRAVADRFAAERTNELTGCFGYHGVWNMPRALGADAFWEVYCQLDDRSTVKRDFNAILRDVWRAPKGTGRAWRMLRERFCPHQG